tara:strand:+ start:772 stop:1551 length:780 start_codon:yes stop_codon:yes gene_type:complete
MASKTIAIVSDVHGNLEALNTALKIIDGRNDVDQTIFLGDYFSLGPAPQEVLEVLKPMNDTVFVRGNHERYIIEKLWTHEKPTLEGMSPDDPIVKGIVEHQEWAAGQIGDEGVDFIQKRTRVSHREIFDSTLMEFTHAWYERDDQPPTLGEAMTWRNHVKKANPGVKMFVFVHGHIHLSRKDEDGDLKVLCPISTGLPFDKVTKGAIGFLTVGDEFNWEILRFDYNLDMTIDLLDNRKPPFYKNLQNTIKYAEIRNESF